MNKFDLLYKQLVEQIEDEKENQTQPSTAVPADAENDSYTPPKQNNEDIFNKLEGFLKSGARFASFIYRTQGTADVKKGEMPNGPTKRYLVNLGISYGNIKEHNLQVIQNYEPVDQYEELAKAELVASLSKPFDPAENLAKQDVYARIGLGIRYNTVGDYLNILGQVKGKPEVLADGEEKPKKDINEIPMNKDGTPRGGDKAYIARAKRVIQQKLRNELRGGLTSYDLDPYKIAGVRLNGEVIEFQSEGNQPLNASKV